MSGTIAQQTANHPHTDEGGYSERFLTVPIYSPLDPKKLLGDLSVHICTKCPHVRAICDHILNTWTHLPDCDGYSTEQARDSKDAPDCSGCLLKCDLCGADGT